MHSGRNLGSLTQKPNILEEQISDKRNAASNADEQLRGSFRGETAQIGQAPAFNIHIHLPENYERSGSKMYLPHIQPVIHLHFDELVREFRHNMPENGGLNKRDIQNLITQAAPKFGSVLFHYKSNSLERHFNKNKINIFSQRQAPKDKNSSMELESNSSSVIETVQKHNSKTTNQCNSNSCKEDAKKKLDDEMSNIVVINGHQIKLKKAVVVLKDICKSNSYKSGVISDVLNQQENQSSSSSSLKIVTNSKPQKKIQSLSSCPSRSNSHEKSEKSNVSNDSYENPFFRASCSSSVNIESPRDEKLRVGESLTSLIEGCNFSEILRRFREKYKSSTSGHLEMQKDLAQVENEKEDNKKLIQPGILSTQNSIQTQEALEIDGLPGLEEEDQEKQKNNDRMNSQNEISINWIKSCENKNKSSPNCYNSKGGIFTKISELNNSESPLLEENRKGLGIVTGDNDIECLKNPAPAAEVESDKDEFTTGSNLGSNVEEIKILEFDSSIYLTKSVLSEPNVIKEDQCFDLKLMEKEMVSPRKKSTDLVKNKKRKSKELGDSEFSPKKIKQLPETPKKSEKEPQGTSTMGEGYIPLKIPGPTEFAVAPLSELQASKTHEAKNFKEEMLFGKRVNRFSSPDHLRMYKLKKEAAGRSCDH